MKEHESEPVRGLPEALPAGETILWQGAPRWGALARRVFHVRGIAVYFAVLVAWLVVSNIHDGVPAMAIVFAALPLAVAGAVAIGLLCAYAWFIARSTLYTVTNRRVVMRFGVALPVAFNLPFRRIKAAGLRVHRDGTGDIPLTLMAGDRINYVVLWPHARPWRFSPAEPMLRAIPDAANVAEILARAAAAEAGTRTGAEAGAQTPSDGALPSQAATAD